MAKTPWTTTAARVARAVLSGLSRAASDRGPRTTTGPTTRPGSPSPGAGRGTTARRRPEAAPATYPGDFAGAVRAEYSPDLDGKPDPGEVVWTWVPYEEDHSRGKDRPVLLVGRDGPWLLGLMLTSKDHGRDAAIEDRHGRRWMDIGAGTWDREGRPSEVRLDRVVRVDPAAVRREGAIVSRELFASVVSRLHA
jgi:hypothetical protein